MRIAVCVPPAAADCYGHHTRYAEKIAELGAGRSIAVEILRYADPDFLARLFTNLQDEECIVHFHCYLYDLKIQATTVAPDVRHALDRCRARTMATISDHPFAGFMQAMVRDAHPDTRFIVIDNTFPDEMRYMNPALGEAEFVHLPFVAPVSFDEDCVVDFDRRAYDLVLPLFIADTSSMSIGSMLGPGVDAWFVRVVTATYEIARTDLSRNPFHILDACMRAEIGTTLDDLRKVQPESVPALLNVLSRLDGLVRHERRAAVIGSLLRSVGDLRVGVLGHPVPSLQVDTKVEFLGGQNTRATAALMADSRAVLNCSPSYPTNVHERITVGMLYGSCVITDVNPYIAETFSDGDFIAYAPGSSMTLEDVFAAHDTRAIAHRSGMRARTDVPFSWPAHFDALLQIAQA